MKKIIVLMAGIFAAFIVYSQEFDLYPSSWWVGMKNPKLQLLIHSKGIANKIPSLKLPAAGYMLAEGVTLKTIHKVENPNYVFLDLVIAKNAKPGMRKFTFVIPGFHTTIEFELKARSKEDGKTRVQGVTSRDFIYLIMPDRFSNGDQSNDYFIDMRDTAHDRSNPFDRHGGDLQGVVNHLDYLKDLGVTAIWMTPVVENDMARTLENGTSRSTYHGYAFTNQYAIDRRLGGNDGYKYMVDATHTRGLKVIQDAVYNHVGNDHWSVKDPPMKDWLNQWPIYTNTTYKDQPLFDPYAADIDKKITTDGWFTAFLPDLNQRNPYVSNFLIQYAIWATEEFGIDGWRVDTYFYNEPSFLNAINTALLNEFPSLTIFGETSVNTVVSGAYYSRNEMEVPFKHNLQGITDFPLFYAMIDAINQKPDGSKGIENLYTTLAEDILYKDPSLNCIFLDNHDQDRIYSTIGEDFNKFKMGINFLLTLRGIPQLYYGTEILMKNKRIPTDAEVRKDFPGGWEQDSVNKFEKTARTAQEEEAWEYISKLATFRKKSSAIGSGKLMQYSPLNGGYVYFRYDNTQSVMTISNAGAKSFKPDWKRFEQRIKGFTKLRNVITGQELTMDGLEVQPNESFVFELLK